jgi:hypothetical protein
MMDQAEVIQKVKERLDGFIFALSIGCCQGIAMTPKCPKCGKEGEKTKQWSYGPKTKKGPHFDVTLYECPSSHKWREYRKKD